MPPKKEHLGALITDCNQAKVFFLSEKMPHSQASDETTGFLIWHLMCRQVANESQSLDGSSTSMTTHSESKAILDVGSQWHCH